MMTNADIALVESTGTLVTIDAAPRVEGRWINVVSHLDPRYGGLSAAVPELGTAVARSGSLAVELAAFCSPDESQVSQSSTLETSYWPTSRLTWARERELRPRLRREIARMDGVHIHGLWEQSTAIAASIARELHKPYVVSAHGMLEPWALANRRWKKRVYAALVERKNIMGAACMHALTGAEAEDYRRFGYCGPIAVIPNGVHIPESLSAEPFLQQFPALRQKRLLLFLGRLHPKKGLDILIESWSALAAQWPDSHLVLAGPDFEGTRAVIEKRLAELGLTEWVSLPGMLSGALKWGALAAAECFLLPSYSEGLSVSVLEAMGAGVPVIISKQCNLPEVARVGAGWLIEANTKALTSAMQEALANSRAANQLLGGRGQALVQAHYNWAAVAGQMSELYGWLQGGAMPLNLELRRAIP